MLSHRRSLRTKRIMQFENLQFQKTWSTLIVTHFTHTSLTLPPTSASSGQVPPSILSEGTNRPGPREAVSLGPRSLPPCLLPPRPAPVLCLRCPQSVLVTSVLSLWSFPPFPLAVSGALSPRKPHSGPPHLSCISFIGLFQPFSSFPSIFASMNIFSLQYHFLFVFWDPSALPRCLT